MVDGRPPGVLGNDGLGSAPATVQPPSNGDAPNLSSPVSPLRFDPAVAGALAGSSRKSIPDFDRVAISLTFAVVSDVKLKVSIQFGYGSPNVELKKSAAPEDKR